MKLRPRLVLFGFGAVTLGGTAATVRLIDIAVPSGLTLPNTAGGREKKAYILETTGNGAAIFDYDGDGANDIFIANGTTLEGPGKGTPRTSHLYHNDGHGKEKGRRVRRGSRQRDQPSQRDRPWS